MFNSTNSGGSGNRGPGTDLKGGFATTAAAMIALLLASPFNTMSAPYVIALARQSYSDEIVDLIGIAWMILAYPFVFFAARASIVAGLTTAGLYLAHRLI